MRSALRPERALVTKTDRLILVVAQITQELRRKFLGRSIRGAGQRTRAPFQRRVLERSRAGRSHVRSRKRRKHERGLQELTSSHEDA